MARDHPGKIAVSPTVRIDTADDLSRHYTPGVADLCRQVADDPAALRLVTGTGNTVLVISDGSAVLGLGDVGPRAALPILEGKAALFARLAGIDAWPLAVDCRDVDRLVETVAAVSTGAGGVNLEDIAAPRCFDIETRLQESLDVPVFHDDQHGTAIAVSAALHNAVRVLGRTWDELTVVISGAGAAGTGVAKLLLHQGVGDVVVCDSTGALHPDRDLDGMKRWLAEHTNRQGISGTVQEALRGADVFIGVSVGGLLGGDDLAAMADDPIVFALANPEPEIEPDEAAKHAAVVATGRSDHPNQINNVLVFPGVFRGLLDSGHRDVTLDLEAAAAEALAGALPDDQLSADRILPDALDPDVVRALARAVAAGSGSGDDRLAP